MNTYLKVVFLFILFTTAAKTMQAQTDTIITIKNFTVYENNDNRFIEWTTDSTVGTNYWKVERSQDGTAFTTLAIVLGSRPGKPANSFACKEKIIANKNASKYYRLCHIQSNGNTQYSQILTPAK
jgi:hypothetical protein